MEYAAVGSRGDESICRRLTRLTTDFMSFRHAVGNTAYDVVHLNPSLGASAVIRDGLLLRAAKRAGRRVLVFFHGWDRKFESQLVGFRLELFKATYFRADAIVVLAEQFRDQLRKWGYRGNVFTETTTFDDAQADIDPVELAKERSRHTGTRLLFLGRVIREKGVFETLEAYRSLKCRQLELSLVIAGDGPDLDSARAWADRAQLRDVEFPGYVTGDKKNMYFREADVYVFPTCFGEGMPVSVLEAMAFALPIVIRPAGGLPDFFEDGKMGAMVEDDAPGTLAEALSRIIQSKAGMAAMGEYNWNYSQEHFVASRVAQRIEEIYRRTAA